MNVRRIRSDEWVPLRDLRLRALWDSPDAFGSTFERERTDSEEDWRAWAEAGSGDEDQALFIATNDESTWIGMAMGAYAEEASDLAHLFAMWVEPRHRGMGAGTMLVESVAAWAARCGAVRLRLRVTETNEIATALYERRGFAPLGVREPLRQGSRLMTSLMERSLTNETT